MSHEVVIPSGIFSAMRAHLFQSDLEQAAFLFATVATGSTSSSATQCPLADGTCKWTFI